MKKMREYIQKHYIGVIFIVLISLVVFLSIGWSAFNSTYTIDGFAWVRIPSEVRVTSFSVSQVNNGALGTYENYGVNFVTANATLPNANSTITYEVEVTNLQLSSGVEVGILRAIGLPENLKILSWSGYNLKDKICDDNNPSDCGSGAQKTFYITVGYANSSYYDSSNTNFIFNIHFDFREYHNITYNNISGNYPTEIIDGDDLSITLNNVSTLELKVEGSNEYVNNTDYTYSSNVLTVNGVSEDLTISKLQSYIITYDANGGYFDGDPSITTNSVTYVWRNNQNNIISGTEKTPTNTNGTFDNWYTDNTNYVTLFSTASQINQNRTVYAKWNSFTLLSVTQLSEGDYVIYTDANGVDRECIVLYDSTSSYGIQIITTSTVKDFEIGNGTGKSSAVYNVSTNNGTTKYAKAKAAYNNARQNLNEEAREYLNSDLSPTNGARVVGSPPDNPDVVNNNLTSTRYTYVNNEGVKEGDTYYTTDLNQMNKSNINTASISDAYWLGSIYSYVGSTTSLYVRLMRPNSDEPQNSSSIIYPNRIVAAKSSSSSSLSYSYEYGLRPVFTLKDTLYIVGGGTQSNPYTLTTGE